MKLENIQTALKEITEAYSEGLQASVQALFIFFIYCTRHTSSVVWLCSHGGTGARKNTSPSRSSTWKVCLACLPTGAQGTLLISLHPRPSRKACKYVAHWFELRTTRSISCCVLSAPKRGRCDVRMRNGSGLRQGSGWCVLFRDAHHTVSSFIHELHAFFTMCLITFSGWFFIFNQP